MGSEIFLPVNTRDSIPPENGGDTCSFTIAFEGVEESEMERSASQPPIPSPRDDSRRTVFLKK